MKTRSDVHGCFPLTVGMLLQVLAAFLCSPCGTQTCESVSSVPEVHPVVQDARVPKPSPSFWVWRSLPCFSVVLNAAGITLLSLDICIDL